MNTTRRPYALEPNAGEAWWVRGNLFAFKASAREVGEGFAVVETVLHPVAAAPAHIHHSTDEAIYMLDGQMAVDVGSEHLVLRPGSFAFLPRGVPHRYLPQEPGPVRALWMLTPAGFEDYWREIGTKVQPGQGPPTPVPPDPAYMARVGQKFATEFLP